jgi:2-C-methyl-D-erythritol 4-phosphate cytidylyltransferase
MSDAAVLVAAGAGVRMGAPVPKALMPLAGRPMLAWSLDALRASPGIGAIVVAAPPGLEDAVAQAAGEGVVVVPGGPSRAESVREALAAVPGAARRVLVHDAARPLLSAELVAAVLAGVDGADGAIAAAPVADTLKSGADGLVGATVPRAGLWAAQTPQAFAADVFRAAVAAADAAGTLAAATDCAAVVEARGGRVRLVESRAPNLKVTTPADALVAEALLAARV